LVFTEEVDDLKIDSLAPFYHGVASGDPLEDRVIIWTRVTPKTKLNKVPVKWKISSAADFKNLINEGVFVTNIDRDYTVKVDVDRLSPGETYYYKFEAFGTESIVGKTKTISNLTDSLRFAAISCSDYQRGFFNAYASLAYEDLDVVIHLGDYIYEYKSRDYSNGIFERLHLPDREILSLYDYRVRHSQYKLDPDLINAHKNHPFILIWDDHETTNDTYKDGAENHQEDEEGSFSKRISSALQAYYEWQPIREKQKPYRKFQFGYLADLIILEERLEGRTKQAESLEDTSLFLLDRTMLGETQLEWFLSNLSDKSSQWKIIGNQVIFSYLNYGRPDFNINLDSWDGYPVERQKIADHIIKNNIDDVVFLTGDTHQSWAFEVNHIPLESNIPIKPYALEFGTPSINSGNSDERFSNVPIQNLIDHENYILDKSINPHLKYTNTRDHGYLIIDLNRDRINATWKYVKTLIRRDKSIKETIQIESNSKSNKLRKII
tara:strand:- start:10056 stop:11534 length:1479 start_codon:yes stop_codon:yes gene_type:complete